MLKNLNRREKNILAASIAVIIIAVGYKAIVEPILADNDSLNQQITLTRLKLRNYLRLLNQKDVLQAEYAKISNLAGMPKEGEDVSTGVLEEIEELAKKSDVRIIDMRPQIQKSPASKENSVELRAEGDMESYLKFIYSIENSMVLLQIKRFQLSSKLDSANLEGNFLISQASL